MPIFLHNISYAYRVFHQIFWDPPLPTLIRVRLEDDETRLLPKALGELDRNWLDRGIVAVPSGRPSFLFHTLCSTLRGPAVSDVKLVSATNLTRVRWSTNCRSTSIRVSRRWRWRAITRNSCFSTLGYLLIFSFFAQGNIATSFPLKFDLRKSTLSSSRSNRNRYIFKRVVVNFYT